ncbi:hypothetical protein BC629DRAFT_628797 [Irpex lacteus]|nr:hypothetical protein BC629DRAFT_628797 [Irpex lacteus]
MLLVDLSDHRARLIPSTPDCAHPQVSNSPTQNHRNRQRRHGPFLVIAFKRTLNVSSPLPRRLPQLCNDVCCTRLKSRPSPPCRPRLYQQDQAASADRARAVRMRECVYGCSNLGEQVHWALCTSVFGKRNIGYSGRESLNVLDHEFSLDSTYGVRYLHTP